ncbi:MAG: dienelactone hydrolase family protein, partial [Planctomycetota bacterium]
MKNLALLAASALALSSCSSSPSDTTVYEIQSREVTYDDQGTPLTGYVARPADREGLVPGVLVVHEWWGHNDYARSRARELAKLGYIAFALDMYGDGKQASHPKDATAFMTEVM